MEAASLAEAAFARELESIVNAVSAGLASRHEPHGTHVMKRHNSLVKAGRSRMWVTTSNAPARNNRSACSG